MNNLVNLSKKDISKAADTLVLALENDPLYTYLFEDANHRKDFLKVFFEMRIKYGLKYGKVYSTSDNFEGITIILSGDDVMTPLKVFKCGGLKIIFKFGKSTMDKMENVMNFLNEIQNKNVDYPVVHISPIGVNPKFQRMGFAKSMLEPILKDLDKNKLGCYLETQNPNNVPFYEKLGFKILESGQIPNSNLSYWCMERKA